MLWLSTEQGFDQVTIGEITARARTAKRTFYAHFADREACFLAAYERVDGAAFAALFQGASSAREPLPRIEAALGALLGYLAAHPREAQLWVLEAQRAGSRPAMARVQTMRRLAELYLALHAEIEATLDPPVPMARTRALAVAGALELPIAVTLADEGAAALPALAGELSRAAYTLVYGTSP